MTTRAEELANCLGDQWARWYYRHELNSYDHDKIQNEELYVKTHPEFREDFNEWFMPVIQSALDQQRRETIEECAQTTTDVSFRDLLKGEDMQTGCARIIHALAERKR